MSSEGFSPLTVDTTVPLRDVESQQTFPGDTPTTGDSELNRRKTVSGRKSKSSRSSIRNPFAGAGASTLSALERYNRRVTQTPRKKGQGPTVQATLSFSKLSYSVPDKHAQTGKRDLLTDFSGAVFPHEMLTVIGPSGSGKTVLLNVLGSRQGKQGKVQGEVLLNGKVASASRRRSLISYVAREVTFMGDFTVYETMWFAGLFYFGFGKDAEIKEKVEALIESVGLKTASHTMVGSLFRKGLSGGQKRRLALAIELISSPSVVLVDEPTSGLDSSAAYAMLMELRSVAAQGHTLVISLNQPTSHVWSCLDLVTVVSEGRQIYYGEVDECLDYFEHTLRIPVPEKCNPADFIISVVMPTDQSHAKRGSYSMDDLAEKFVSSELARVTVAQRIKDCQMSKKTTVYPSKARKSIKGALPPTPATPSTPGGIKASPKVEDELADQGFASKHAGFWAGLITLTWRNVLNVIRNPGVIVIRFLIFVTLAFTFAVIYLQVGTKKDAQNVRATVSVLLGMNAFLPFLSIAVIPFIMEERSVFQREKGNGAYSVLAYVLARLVVMIVTTFVSSLASCAVYVFAVGIRHYIFNVVPIWGILLVAETLVLVIGALSSHFMTGIAVAAAIYGILIVTGGFLIRFDSISWALRWLGYADPLWYSFQALMINQFEGLELDSALYPDGQAVLSAYYIGPHSLSYWEDMAVLVGFVVAFTAMLWAVLVYTST